MGLGFMKKCIATILLISFITQPVMADVIITNQNRKFEGEVLKRVKSKLVVRTKEGSAVMIPVEHVSKIYRGNKVIDFQTKESYYIEKRRPFLPFMVLGAVSAAYSVNRFQEYNRLHSAANVELNQLGANPGEKTSNDTTKPMALGIVAGLFSAGCFYIAMRPMELKVPIGKLKVGMNAQGQGVQLALNF